MPPPSTGTSLSLDLDPIGQHVDVFFDRLVDIALAKCVAGREAKAPLDVKLFGRQGPQQALLVQIEGGIAYARLGVKRAAISSASAIWGRGLGAGRVTSSL